MNRDFIRISFFTLFASLLVAMGISSEIAAQKGPTQGEATYYYGGTWILHQDGLSPITMKIRRIGSEITGEASYDAGRKGIARGVVQGRAWSERYEQPIFMVGIVTINYFEVEIRWNDDVGVYHGTDMGTIGRPTLNSLEGEAWGKATPAIKVGWHTDEVFRQVPPPVKSPPPPPPPKPIKSSGKFRGEPPPTPPFIIASQAIIPTPYHPFGIVPLSWDGGPDHPSVEVWLSMDNGAEIPAFSMELPPIAPVWKQPKISIALQLQRHHHYRFVLKGAGKTLSTAAFVVP